MKREREHGKWVYEFRVINSQGRLREISVDAARGAIEDAGGD